MSFISLDIHMAVLYTLQLAPALPLLDLMLTGVIVVCKCTEASCIGSTAITNSASKEEAEYYFKQTFPVQTSGISSLCVCISLKVLHVATDAIFPTSFTVLIYYFATQNSWKVR